MNLRELGQLSVSFKIIFQNRKSGEGDHRKLKPSVKKIIQISEITPSPTISVGRVDSDVCIMLK